MNTEPRTLTESEIMEYLAAFDISEAFQPLPKWTETDFAIIAAFAPELSKALPR